MNEIEDYPLGERRADYRKSYKKWLESYHMADHYLHEMKRGLEDMLFAQGADDYEGLQKLEEFPDRLGEIFHREEKTKWSQATEEAK